MLVELSEKEAYLIHRMRNDPVNARSAFSLMKCPYEKDNLEEIIEEVKERCFKELEREKEAALLTMRLAKQPVDLIFLNRLEEKYHNKAKEEEARWRNFQSENESGMQQWLLAQRKTGQIVSLTARTNDRRREEWQE